MLATLKWNHQPLQIDLSAGQSLAIPMNPEGPQPTFFTSSAMKSEPLADGNFVGDVRRGGSCNAEILHWAPHCHGTHTECIGHILEKRISVLEAIDTQPVLACLLTIDSPDAQIRRAAIERIFSSLTSDPAALILRTLPNEESKQWRNYTHEPDYPVLTADAVAWLCSQPLRHLLLDTPSLDSADNMALSNHRIWWGQDPNVKQHGFPPENRSITEMIYVGNDLGDGEYWLNLELSPLVSDATPSRPVIYPLTRGAQTDT